MGWIFLYEIYLRCVNYLPLSADNYASIFRSPDLFREDDRLGWSLKPGMHKIQAVSNSTAETVDTILVWKNTASRVTSGSTPTDSQDSNDDIISRRNIVFIGDSFTFGDGLNDAETYPWLVKQKVEGSRVWNFGVPGYGTCQSLLYLKELLSNPELTSSTVIYGISQFHETRNLPDNRTAWDFASKSSTGKYKSPGCSLAPNGSIIELPVRSFENSFSFLSSSFSVGRRLVHFYFDLKDIPLRAIKRPLSYSLLATMQNLVNEHEGNFAVLMQRFDDGSAKEYHDYFDSKGISVINGAHPAELSESMQIPGDGHPNARMNEYWSNQVVDFLR